MKRLCSLALAAFALFICGCVDVPLTEDEMRSDAAPHSPDPMSHIPAPNQRADGSPRDY